MLDNGLSNMSKSPHDVKDGICGVKKVKSQTTCRACHGVLLTLCNQVAFVFM